MLNGYYYKNNYVKKVFVPLSFSRAEPLRNSKLVVGPSPGSCIKGMAPIKIFCSQSNVPSISSCSSKRTRSLQIKNL